MTARNFKQNHWAERAPLVKEVMTRMPFTLAPDVPVGEARELMHSYGVRHIPVIENGEPVGIVSDRDLRAAVTFAGPGHLTVEDVMSSPLYAVSPETPLAQVLDTMIRQKIGSALVVSPHNIVIGIFTTHDALVMLHGLVLLGEKSVSRHEDSTSTSPESAVVIPLERADRRKADAPLDRVDQASQESFPASDAPGWR